MVRSRAFYRNLTTSQACTEVGNAALSKRASPEVIHLSSDVACRCKHWGFPSPVCNYQLAAGSRKESGLSLGNKYLLLASSQETRSFVIACGGKGLADKEGQETCQAPR